MLPFMLNKDVYKAEHIAYSLLAKEMFSEFIGYLPINLPAITNID